MLPHPTWRHSAELGAVLLGSCSPPLVPSLSLPAPQAAWMVQAIAALALLYPCHMNSAICWGMGKRSKLQWLPVGQRWVVQIHKCYMKSGRLRAFSMQGEQEINMVQSHVPVFPAFFPFFPMLPDHLTHHPSYNKPQFCSSKYTGCGSWVSWTQHSKQKGSGKMEVISALCRCSGRLGSGGADRGDARFPEVLSACNALWQAIHQTHHLLGNLITPVEALIMSI